MRDFIVLFLVVIVNISQACPWLPAHYYLVGREGDQDQPNLTNNQTPNGNKPGNQQNKDKKLLYSSLLLRQGLPPVVPPAPPVSDKLTNRQAELDEIDKEALSMLSDEDRQILLTELTPADRKALLVEYEDSELIPVDETRFGVLETGGFAGLGAKIGAGAGGFLGGRIAGSLGAKLGAAAGAYLGAAAARRLESTFRGNANNRGINVNNNMGPQPLPLNPGFQYGTNFAGGFGSYSANQ